MIGTPTPCGKAEQGWPFAVWLSNSYTSTITKRKAQRKLVFSAALVSLCSAWRHLLDVDGHGVACPAPSSWLLVMGHTPVSSAAPQSKSSAFKRLEPCSVSLPKPHSQPSQPDTWGKQAPAAQKKVGPKHHFLPEQHGEVGVLALGIGRLLVLDGEGGLHSPLGRVMMGHDKS